MIPNETTALPCQGIAGSNNYAAQEPSHELKVLFAYVIATNGYTGLIFKQAGDDSSEAMELDGNCDSDERIHFQHNMSNSDTWATDYPLTDVSYDEILDDVDNTDGNSRQVLDLDTMIPVPVSPNINRYCLPETNVNLQNLHNSSSTDSQFMSPTSSSPVDGPFDSQKLNRMASNESIKLSEISCSRSSNSEYSVVEELPERLKPINQVVQESKHKQQNTRRGTFTGSYNETKLMKRGVTDRVRPSIIKRPVIGASKRGRPRKVINYQQSSAKDSSSKRLIRKSKTWGGASRFLNVPSIDELDTRIMDLNSSLQGSIQSEKIQAILENFLQNEDVYVKAKVKIRRKHLANISDFWTHLMEKHCFWVNLMGSTRSRQQMSDMVEYQSRSWLFLAQLCCSCWRRAMAIDSLVVNFANRLLRLMELMRDDIIQILHMIGDTCSDLPCLLLLGHTLDGHLQKVAIKMLNEFGPRKKGKKGDISKRLAPAFHFNEELTILRTKVSQRIQQMKYNILPSKGW